MAAVLVVVCGNVLRLRGQVVCRLAVEGLSYLFIYFLAELGRLGTCYLDRQPNRGRERRARYDWQAAGFPADLDLILEGARTSIIVDYCKYTRKTKPSSSLVEVGRLGRM